MEVIAAQLHALAPRNCGRHTAEQLVQLAQQSSSSRLATTAPTFVGKFGRRWGLTISMASFKESGCSYALLNY